MRDSGHPLEISLVSSRLNSESKHGAGRNFVHGARSGEAGKLSRQRKSFQTSGRSRIA